MRILRDLIRDDDGATAVEYAVMLALIIMACIGTVAILGTNTKTLWEDNNTGLQKAFK